MPSLVGCNSTALQSKVLFYEYQPPDQPFVVDRCIILFRLWFVETPDRSGLSVTFHVDKVKPIVDNPDPFGCLVETIDVVFIPIGAL